MEAQGQVVVPTDQLSMVVPPNIPMVNTAQGDVIELRGVSHSYDGGKSWVIFDLNLLIEHEPGKGKFVVLLGKSGCGKSTLLRYVAGLQSPTRGEVLINGKPRSDKDIVSMVFQQYSSLPFKTVLENVMLPLFFRGISRRETRERAMEMIKAVGLEGHEWKFAKYPILSGGQLQRVAIARSLISNPSIVLMDEPFGALDTNTRYRMQMLLADIFEKYVPTIIFVTHDIPEAVFLGDKIYFMRANPGRIVDQVEVDLPFHRDRSTKREPRFTQLVHEVEDRLWRISEEK